jgi:tRNA(Ile)-lysidine synthase
LAPELAPELIARFRTGLEALTGEAPSPERRLGVAVSGGPDSMAMLLLSAAAYPGAVAAATVDHGLRAEAAAEAKAVADACAGSGVPHATLPVRVAPGNLQEEARQARYAALADWAERERLPWIAVAHQRDDLAETFLMRARRGAGVGGLAAMRASRPLGPNVQLVRPLLDWARCELGQIAGNACAADPSNTDPRFDRARMRALIAATPELLAQRLAFSATNLRHAEDALAWTTTREWQARATGTETVTLDPAGLPYEILRRLAHRAVTTVRAAHHLHAPFREQGLDRLIATLHAGGTGTIAGVKADTKADIWRFVLAPARRSH